MLGHFALAGQLYTPWGSLHGAECEEQNIERGSAGSQQPEVERAGYRLQLCERCARRHGIGAEPGRGSTREGGKNNLPDRHHF